VDADAVLDQLKVILVERLRFDPARTELLSPDTLLPKGVDGSLGLDSLDFIEMALGIENHFGIVMDEGDDLAPHFSSLGTLVHYIASRLGPA
jgi:acyl carrier protein